MRLFFFVFLGFLGVLTFSDAVNAQDNDQVDSKSFGDHMEATGKYFWGPPNTDPKRKHLKEALVPHNNQWDEADWHPEYWVENKGSVEAVIDGFYDSGVIVEQYEDEVPVLEVGQPFLRLSPPDQRRVIEFVDYAFQITSSKPHGLFYIVLEDHDDQLLGLYTQHGLQMQ